MRVIRVVSSRSQTAAAPNPPAVPTGPLVDKEHRAARVESDRERDQQHERSGEKKADRGRQDTRRTPLSELQARLAEGAGEDEKRRSQRLDGQLAAERLVRA